MATLDSFSFQVNRLHRAFGVIPGEAKMRERLGQKIGEWFDMWQKSFSLIGDEILAKMVDKAINDCDRLPTFAQFRALRNSIQGEIPIQGYARTSCLMCQGGLIRAWKDIPGHGPSTFVFRCSACENWMGKFDGLPIWNPAAGYNPGEAPRPEVAVPAGKYRPRYIAPEPGFPALEDDAKERLRYRSLRQEEKRDLPPPAREQAYDAFADLGFERREDRI